MQCHVWCPHHRCHHITLQWIETLHGALGFGAHTIALWSPASILTLHCELLKDPEIGRQCHVWCTHHSHHHRALHCDALTCLEILGNRKHYTVYWLDHAIFGAHTIITTNTIAHCTAMHLLELLQDFEIGAPIVGTNIAPLALYGNSTWCTW